MNELFSLAAESMLQVYGSDAVMIHPYSDNETVRISPLFSAKLRRESSVSGNLAAEANVIISGCSSEPVPQKDKLHRNGVEWIILTVKEICPGVFELELKQ